MATDLVDRENFPIPIRPVADCGGMAGRRRPRRAAQARESIVEATLSLMVFWMAGCTASSPLADSLLLGPPGPGVIFSYPVDGQYDVSLGARILLAFSADLSTTPIDGTCTRAGDQVTGAFCVEGPDGFASGVPTVEGSTLVFAPAGGFAAGATYRVWARPALLPGATNLPAPEPLLTFHTRSVRTRGGEAATIVTANGAPLYPDGSSVAPFLDAAPIRLLFSEPLDPTTVTSDSVRLLCVKDSTPVDGIVVARGIHLTFQPTQKLQAGETYQLTITDAVRDLGGEQITPVSLTFTAWRTAAPGEELSPLSLNVEPAWTDGASQPRSRLGATPVNASVLSSQLIGSNVLGMVSGGLEALVGGPLVSGTSVPMLVRRGQRLDLTSLSIRYGGVLETGMQTGAVHFTTLTDACGMLRRNPLRSPNQQPDDAQAPIYVELTMDAVISSDDMQGNVLTTQTVMGIQLLGLLVLDGDQFVIDQVGMFDFDLLGVDTAPVTLAMRMRTGTKAATPELGVPSLLSAFPANGAHGVSPAGTIVLNFSGPLDPALSNGVSELTLTQGTTVIPTSARLEGTTLVVVPSQRLDEGVVTTLSYAGLRSMSGVAVADGTLSFTTAVTSSDGAAPPPIITALTPGAPCALTGTSATSAGRCAGGKSSDSNYQPFVLPANRDVRVRFSQPLDPASLTLGTACGQGSIRVESVGADGQCAAVVSGSLVKRDREVRFLSSQPWVAGAAYRLTLVGGSDTNCDTNEICSRNGSPLNTDPLSGTGSGNAGGPDVVIDFTGAPATLDTYQPLASDPVADQNGDGVLDGAEQPNDQNRVAMEITGYGGIITSASLLGDDCLPDRDGQQACSYLSATLPASVGGVRASCPIDSQGQPASAANPCIEVTVYPNSIIGTSIAMATTASVVIPIPIDNLPTGMTVMRLREMGAPIRGYIMQEAGAASPEFVIRQDLYFDAPDLTIPLASHDLKSKPLGVTLKGPVTFRPDGRMDIALRNLEDVSLQINVSALLLPGNIDLRIPAGEMRVTLAGPVLR